jgi:hypothetical protein
MKKLLSFLLLSFLAFASCRQVVEPQTQATLDPNRIINEPFFSQSSTAFRAPHVENLVTLWRSETVKSLVNFAVVNDQRTYEEVFRGVAAPLPAIDFSQNTLLIGRRGAEYGNGPANIKQMSQSLTLVNNEWQYRVLITHRSNGGEWFGFTRLVPKITDASSVKLVMEYRLEP